MSLEQQITQGHATYLLALGYDLYQSRLMIVCLADPEATVIARTVILRGVTRYRDTWRADEPLDDADIDSIIAIDTYSMGAHTRYVICTEYREISFEMRTQPEIIDASA